jgi:hypothetical protein
MPGVWNQAGLFQRSIRRFQIVNLFRGLRPIERASAVRDVLAGVVLAAMDIPQVMGYSKIAGMPVVTGLYSLMLPLVAFAAFGSSRYLVVAADSATAAIFAGGISGGATPAAAQYVALAGIVLVPPSPRGKPVPRQFYDLRQQSLTTSRRRLRSCSGIDPSNFTSKKWSVA